MVFVMFSDTLSKRVFFQSQHPGFNLSFQPQSQLPDFDLSLQPQSQLPGSNLSLQSQSQSSGFNLSLQPQSQPSINSKKCFFVSKFAFVSMYAYICIFLPVLFNATQIEFPSAHTNTNHGVISSSTNDYTR